MSTPNDTTVQLGTGQLLRNIACTVMINNVPTTVLMEVISISDSNGNVIDEFIDYNFNREMLSLMRSMYLLLCSIAGQVDDNPNMNVDIGDPRQ